MVYRSAVEEFEQTLFSTITQLHSVSHTALASCLIYARPLLEYVIIVMWLRSVIKSERYCRTVHCFQNIWFNKRTHPNANEQRNRHRLSTKWVRGSDQSSVRLWPCAANQGVVVCGRAVWRKGLCIN